MWAPRRLLARVLPSLVLLLAVAHGGATLLPLARAVGYAALRLAHICVLLSGAVTFWWMLRAYQLGIEQELYDHALAQYTFFQKYNPNFPHTRRNGATTTSTATNIHANSNGYASQRIRAEPRPRRLPVATHLQTVRGLPAVISDELAAFAALVVRDYVTHWFASISHNHAFPEDVEFAVADLLGAMVARVLEIDSTLALTLVAKSAELVRLHLGWFREAYATLSEEHPLVFQGGDEASDAGDALLRRRQQLLAAYVRRAPFLHPGCASSATTMTMTTTDDAVHRSANDTPSSAAVPPRKDPADVRYLRHMVTELLVQLNPELGAASGDGDGDGMGVALFAAMARHFLREAAVFRIVLPMVEYTHPRYANELVSSLLSALLVDKREGNVLSPTNAQTGAGPASGSGSALGLGFNMPMPPLPGGSIELPKLRALKMSRGFLYKASKRSSEQAEAAFQAVVDAVSTAASHATPQARHGPTTTRTTTSTTTTTTVGHDDYWSESLAFGLTSPSTPTSPLSPMVASPRVDRPHSASAASAGEKRGHFASMFSLDDRLTFPRTPRFMTSSRGHHQAAPPQRGSMHEDPSAVMSPPLTSVAAPKSAPKSLSIGIPGSSRQHMDELKNMRANLESSFSSSMFKVKKRLRDLPTPMGVPSAATATATARAQAASAHAANLMKQPGKLFQKALRRSDIPVPSAMMRPQTMAAGLDLAGVPAGEIESSDLDDDGDDDDNDNDELDGFVTTSRYRAGRQHHGSSRVLRVESSLEAEDEAQERVVMVLDTAVVNYMRLYHERREMRNSARSRELYELLVALEDVFALGFQHPGDAERNLSEDGEQIESDENDDMDRGEKHGRGDQFDGDDDDGATATSEGACSQGSSAGPRPTDGFDSNSNTTGDGVNQLYWSYLAHDRPEAPALNEHWRFVATQCPMCADSESFYSSRGIQWLLLALEKGSLWEYLSALHLGSRVTEEFYAPHAVLCNGKSMVSVLESVSLLSKVKVTLEIPHLLGRGNDDVDQELATVLASIEDGNDTLSSVLLAPAAFTGSVCVLESVWELERYVPIHGWIKTQDKRTKELPSSEWIWETGWLLDVPGTDPLEADHTWEYAKTFEDRFHEKEKKFDSVRRRKWIRRRRHLPPVLVLPPSNIATVSPLASPLQTSSHVPSTSPSLASSPHSTTVSSLTALPSPMSGGTDCRQSSGVDEGDTASNARRRSYSLKKSRSSSLDKTAVDRDSPSNFAINSEAASMPSSPVKSSWSLPSPSMSASAAALTAKKRSLMMSMSLKRSSGSSNDKEGRTKRNSFNQGSSRNSSSSIQEDEVNDRAFGNDDDEEGCVCFRCSQPLAEQNITVDGDPVSSCPCCKQRVCVSCLVFRAFVVYPPPSQASTKDLVCSTCYTRCVRRYKLPLEAHVSRYFINEKDRESVGTSDVATVVSPSKAGVPSALDNSSVTVVNSNANSASVTADATPSLGAGNSNSSKTDGVNRIHDVDGTGVNNQRFEVTVRLKNESPLSWSVVKSYHEFEVLEKQLYEKWKKQEKEHGAGCLNTHWKGVDYTEMRNVTPLLKDVAAALASSAINISYTQRISVLTTFLQRLVDCDTVCQSSAVQKFFALGSNAVVNGAMSSGGGCDNGSPVSGIDGESRGRFGGPGASISALSGVVGAAANHVLTLEAGKWKKGKWIAPEASTKSAKMRVLQQLEVSLFATLNEVFEFDGISMVRRQLFAVTRSFIRAFLSASHFRKLERQYLSFTDPTKMASMLGQFREYMFPTTVSETPALSSTENLGAVEMRSLRKESLDAILSSFPSSSISLFGETSCANAALKLHEFVQHEVFLKNLLFSIADEVLPHLFPDIAPYAPKTKAQNAKERNRAS